MRLASPLRLIVVGAILLMLGVLVPLLMVLRLWKPTFFLSFLSYASSLVGLIVGVWGIAQYHSTPHKDNTEREERDEEG